MIDQPMIAQPAAPASVPRPSPFLALPPGVLMFAGIYAVAFYVWGGLFAALYDPD